MNTMLIAALTMPTSHGLTGLLIGFLVIIVVIAIIAGLIYAIETWIMKESLPTPVKLVIGLILIVLIIIWAIGAIGGG
jgi:hypothetical protein